MCCQNCNMKVIKITLLKFACFCSNHRTSKRILEQSFVLIPGMAAKMLQLQRANLKGKLRSVCVCWGGGCEELLLR
jgi:hypothetical protein